MNIPESLYHKIMMYNSHPVADLIKTNIQTVKASGNNNYGSSTYADMYFNCMEKHFNECFKRKSWLWLSKTKRKFIGSNRYPYNMKHLTNEHIWND